MTSPTRLAVLALASMCVHQTLAQNPTMSLIPLVEDVRRECVGGPNEGQACASAADCEVEPECLRVCQGGPDDGLSCSDALVCSTRSCAQQCFCNFVITASPGDFVSAEAFGAHWSPNGEKLRGWELILAFSGIEKDVRLLGADMPPQLTFCDSDEECPPEYPFCIASTCAGPDHNPQLGMFVDTDRADYVFFGLGTEAGPAFSLGYPRYDVASFLLSQEEAVAFTVPRYFFSLIVEIIADVGARFTIPFTTAGRTRFEDQAKAYIVPLDQEGLTIEVVEPPPPPEDIPATSTWGLVALSLVLLAGAKVHFGRRLAA